MLFDRDLWNFSVGKKEKDEFKWKDEAQLFTYKYMTYRNTTYTLTYTYKTFTYKNKKSKHKKAV